MGLSRYLCKNEIEELNQTFERSLEHDSVLVFWTGISPKLAKDWACENDLKTLTIAMGPLYAENSQKSLRARKSKKSWSNYMKGASWLFAQKACQNRRAVVLTNAPPNVYSTREHSNYRDIEEPILKGLETNERTIQIDYVHPTVSGAACFRYQTWPTDRSSEWFDFLECITIKNILIKFMQRIRLQKSRTSRLADDLMPDQKPQKSRSLRAVFRDTHTDAAQRSKIAKQAKLEKEQQGARERRAAKQAKVEREKQAAREKRAAKQAKVKREQQRAQEKRAAKQAKVEREQQAAQEKKAAKQAKVEREQQAAQDKKAAKQAKVEREQQAAQERKAAKQAKVEREQQAAQDKKAAKKAKAGREQQEAREKRAAKL